jgi:hypothetical protein
VPVAVQPALRDQIVPIGGPAQAVPFLPETQMVRLHCDLGCSILFGDNPTATTSNARMAANQTEYWSFQVHPGLTLSVVANP